MSGGWLVVHGGFYVVVFSLLALIKLNDVPIDYGLNEP